MKLNVKAFALAAGILWAAAMAICTVISLANGFAAQFMALMADIYPGYSVSAAGIVIGAVYGFIDAFVGFGVLAWLYNRFAK